MRGLPINDATNFNALYCHCRQIYLSCAEHVRFARWHERVVQIKEYRFDGGVFQLVSTISHEWFFTWFAQHSNTVLITFKLKISHEINIFAQSREIDFFFLSVSAAAHTWSERKFQVQQFCLFTTATSGEIHHRNVGIGERANRWFSTEGWSLGWENVRATLNSVVEAHYSRTAEVCSGSFN